jgi:hypothetical protein
LTAVVDPIGSTGHFRRMRRQSPRILRRRRRVGAFDGGG